MKLHRYTDALPQVSINQSTITGFCSEPFESYWNAKYVFELSEDDLLFDEMYATKGREVPDDLYIFAPYNNANYEHVCFAAIGRSLGQSKLRVHLNYNFYNWIGNESLQIFCSKLASQLNKNPDILVSSVNRDLDSVELLVDTRLESARSVRDTMNNLLFNIKTSHELVHI